MSTSLPTPRRPKPKKARPSLARAEMALRNARDEEWAAIALDLLLTRVVTLIIQGRVL